MKEIVFDGSNPDIELHIKAGSFFYPETVLVIVHGITMKIPSYFMSDGPTLNWFTRIFFSCAEYKMGVVAAWVHDYMCNHKHKYDRKTSSRILRDLWVAAGLSKIKGQLMYLFVDLYQWWDSKDSWKS